MRKLRVNIFDDDAIILKMLKVAMSQRGYEILTFERAVACPINGAKSDNCNSLNPCVDIIITDYKMPEMTGLEMLLHQAQNGCKVNMLNKLVMSADLDNESRTILEGLGCTFFSKPFKLRELSTWLDDCEKRIDLSKPLATIKKEERYPANIDIAYAYNAGDKTYKATVINYSSSGLCLKVGAPLTERQSIVIKTELPIDCKNASVRWVKEMGFDFYMAGCSCC
jgi:response regulator RpfG family c-di-GMP phosphodiesterase